MAEHWSRCVQVKLEKLAQDGGKPDASRGQLEKLGQDGGTCRRCLVKVNIEIGQGAGCRTDDANNDKMVLDEEPTVYLMKRWQCVEDGALAAALRFRFATIPVCDQINFPI